MEKYEFYIHYQYINANLFKRFYIFQLIIVKHSNNFFRANLSAIQKSVCKLSIPSLSEHLQSTPQKIVDLQNIPMLIRYMYESNQYL